MKIICVILCVSLLISGCYSLAPLTKGESARDDRHVTFYLQDSSRVESQWYHHKRVGDGYEVDGKRFKDGEEQEFHVLIRDQDIVKIEITEPDNGAFLMAGILVIGVIALAAIAVSNAHPFSYL